MLSLKYANAFRHHPSHAHVKINAATPSQIATDLNGHDGTHTAELGAKIVVDLATLPDSGPSGGYFNEDGPLPWKRSFLTIHSRISISIPMPRIKEFDRDKALASAVDVFREHGFDGTSTEMLVQAMKIGRQSLYDTFGDKWTLYRLAVQRYALAETEAHIRELRGHACAIHGISAMMDRVVAEADRACLGVNSICEFGQSRRDLTDVHLAADHRLRHAARECIRQAQDAGDLDQSASPDAVIDFLIASIAGIRIAARGGAGQEVLQSLGRLALRALMPR